MIIIKTILKYSKLLAMFILLELFISFIMGFLNLLGIPSDLTGIILFIINMLIFFVYAYKCGKVTNKKGIIQGIITGLMLISLLFLISIIFFINTITYKTFIYYLLLLISSIIGGTIGKNQKKDSTSQDKK